jgi:hypothetical protein
MEPNEINERIPLIFHCESCSGEIKILHPIGIKRWCDCRRSSVQVKGTSTYCQGMLHIEMRKIYEN